jgi:valyl-tRNA synthetase
MKNSINLEANKVSTNKSLFCKYYNKKRYLETKYFKKYSELKNRNKNQNKDKSSKSNEKPLSNKQIIIAFSTLLANLTEKSKNKIILDLGALEYFSSNKN